MRYLAVLTSLPLTLAAAGCGDDLTTPEQTLFGGDRVVELAVPSTYDHSTPTPLLVVLQDSVQGMGETHVTVLCQGQAH